MTAQLADTLILNDQKLAMCSIPLECCFSFGGALSKPVPHYGGAILEHENYHLVGMN